MRKSKAKKATNLINVSSLTDAELAELLWGEARCPGCGAVTEYEDRGEYALLCRECADARPTDDGWGDAPRHGYDY